MNGFQFTTGLITTSPIAVTTEASPQPVSTGITLSTSLVSTGETIVTTSLVSTTSAVFIGDQASAEKISIVGATIGSIGGVALVTLVVAIVVFLIRRRKSETENHEEELNSYK